MKKKLFVTAVAVGVAIVTVQITAQQRPNAPFTAAQADAGKAAYESACSSCHMPNLAGSSDASPLSGTKH